MDKSSPNIDILPMSVEGLTFSAGGKDILYQINFRLNADGKTFIVGPNGAGKSVLLKVCHGLLTQQSGKVVWSSCAENNSDYKQGMLFQRPMLLRRSARANIEYALAVRGISGLLQG